MNKKQAGVRMVRMDGPALAQRPSLDASAMTVSLRYPTPLLDELQYFASHPKEGWRGAWALLQRGTDVNAPDKDGRTALHQAMITPGVTLKFLRAMLNAGANVNATGVDGTTPLHHAAARGDVQRAKLLLGAGADPNLNRDEMLQNGKTALHTAVSHQHLEMVNLLLEHGAEVDRLGWNHRLQFCQTFTALHLAVQTDQITMMERLVAAGANPDALFLTTLTDGPLPVTQSETMLEIAAPEARAWLERRVLSALDEEALPPSSSRLHRTSRRL